MPFKISQHQKWELVCDSSLKSWLWSKGKIFKQNSISSCKVQDEKCVNKKWGLQTDSISRALAFCPAVNLSNLAASSNFEIRTCQKRLSIIRVGACKLSFSV